VRRAAARVGEERDAGARERHPDEVERPPRADHRHGQRAEELDGDGDPERGAGERLVERDVHRDEDDAERGDEAEVAPGAPAELRPGDRPERRRAEDEPQEDDARRPEPGKERLRGGRPDLYRAGRAEDPGDRRGAPLHYFFSESAAPTASRKIPRTRGQWSAIRSEPKRPHLSIAAPIASCPAMRMPTVAATPIRGPA
jgi:hypothetical protein